MSALITLLTDFGYQDAYVGVMKGVIVSICQSVRILDLTHAVPPQNIAAARFTLLTAVPYFPPGTIYVVVVDPGVGTERRAIAIQTPTGYFVGPDNGVFGDVVDDWKISAVVSLTQPCYWRTPAPSKTFHGRDVFAPVAAHLAAGVPLANLGTAIPVESLVKIAIPAPTITATSAIGHVQHIDRFGNLITTLPASVVHQRLWKIHVGSVEISLGQTYGDVPLRHPLALVGSHGWLEIAVNGGSAQQRFQLTVGDAIQLQVDP